jgi:MFS family permease
MYLHMVYAVFLISWPLFPVYLYRLNFTLIEVGVLFSLAGLAEVVFTYATGKLLDKIPCNYGLALIDFFGGIASIVYGFSQNYSHIIVGKLLDKIGWVFNPSYTVYENEAYKKDYETLYQYHVMTPEIVQLVAFPVLGFLLTYVFNSVAAYRLFFIVLGIADFGVIVYIVKVLPRVEPAVSVPSFQFSLPQRMYALVTAEVILTFGEAVGSQFILVYYILNILNKSFFTVTLVEAVVSFAIIATVVYTLRRTPDPVKAAQCGIIFMIMYAALMSWAPTVWVVFAAYFLVSVGHSLWFPRHRTWIMQVIPEHRRGELLGSISSLNKLVSIAAPVFASFIAVKVYILAPFVVQLGTLLFVFFIYEWMNKG